MSHRPVLKKRAQRVRKILSRSPLPKNIDLVHYLRTRGHAETAGGARKMLEEGKVRSESHVLGRVKMTVLEKGKEEERWVAQPVVPAKYRDSLQVIS